MDFSKPLEIKTTPIPGLLIISLPVHGDARGWFKENWQRKKMTELGLPDFGPVQNNISFNQKRGVTRGIHAEPWDKYISVGSGRIFGAWVDLREGETFGTVFTTEINPAVAVFVPRGIGNAFQTLEDNTVYSYLVNDHWSAENNDYAFVNLADPTLAIDWPIPLNGSELSEKDKNHPSLKDISPIPPKKILVTGANGQVGLALRDYFPNAEYVDHHDFDITNEQSWQSKDWRQYGTIINAAAYTNVDGAETESGRRDAWRSNAEAVRLMTAVAREAGITLVHLSSDYVFDGSEELHTENEPLSPLGVYGQTKAAGDLLVKTIPRHYIIRTSWVIGRGKNFVTTMRDLANRNVDPSVVNDQFGRLSFAGDIARAIKHLLDSAAPYGTYNMTNSGTPSSWFTVAQKVYELSGHSVSRVAGISTAKYFEGKPVAAPRPLKSTLDLTKIESTGFVPRGWEQALEAYINQLQKETTT